MSAATRWQALESMAKREQWNVVLASPAGHTLVAYINPAGASGVRDRVKVELSPYDLQRGRITYRFK